MWNMKAEVVVWCLLALVSDLDAYTIQTTSCVDYGKLLVRHDFCEYTCQVGDLQPGDFFSVTKIKWRTYGVLGNGSSPTSAVTFNSTDGLNPALPDRYHATLHDDNLGVTINITDVIPGESGDYVCIITNSQGEEMARSAVTYIPILGAAIEVSFSPEGKEITLTKEQLEDVMFNVTVSDLMAVPPKSSIVVRYPAVSLEEEITRHFHHKPRFSHTWHREGGIVSVSRTELFRDLQPAAIKTDQGKPTLVGSYEYSLEKVSTNVTIILLFAPLISCDTTRLGTFGKPFSVTCKLNTNPMASHSVKLPSGETVNGTGHDNVKVSVTPTEIDWMYKFTVTYEKLSSDLTGQHSVRVVNEYGESTYRVSVEGGTGASSTVELHHLSVMFFLILMFFRINW